MATNSYTKQTWEDAPSTNSPISAERLNHMETGIKDNNTGVRALETAVGNVQNLSTSSKEVVGSINEINQDILDLADTLGSVDNDVEIIKTDLTLATSSINTSGKSSVGAMPTNVIYKYGKIVTISAFGYFTLSASSYVSIGTIPQGFRPMVDIHGAATFLSDDVDVEVLINNTGNVSFRSSKSVTNRYISFNITYATN